MMRIAFIFPGQGAQYPGMGKDFFEQFPLARHTFEEADDLLKQPLSKCIFEGPKEELTLTKNAQVAIFVVSCAILKTTSSLFPDIKPLICAGLSLGEYTALVASGKLSFEVCLKLVSLRGTFMHEACLQEKGAMAVVLGEEPQSVQEKLDGLEGVWIANMNCPGQVVIAGKEASLSQAALQLKDKGVKRVLPLEVSGAFHTPLMKSAKENLSPYIDAAPFEEGSSKIILNAVGEEVADLQEIKTLLKEQVVSPVYWEKGIRKMESKGCDLFLEMGPGTTLAGMNKRIGVSVPTVSIEKIAQLESLYAFT